MPDATPLPPTFPRDDSLCESCGYSLRGLTSGGVCPECGSAISDSDPVRRTGLPWQNEMSIRSWLKTKWMMVRRPREAYRVMRIDRMGTIRSRRQVWLYQLSFAVLAGLIVGLMAMILDRHTLSFRSSKARYMPGELLMIFGGASMLLVTSLAMLEAAGVTWVARRRGWRVSYWVAFSVAAYCGVCWLPAMFLTCLAVLWMEGAVNLFNWQPFPGGLPDLFILIIIFAISILWFEALVWLGVRQVKFANSD